ncbi:MAG: acyltransferase family protein [Ilumatobacteraceae bacterium]
MNTQSSPSAPLGGTPAWGTRRGPIVPYVPALDGLRALAVTAVVVYHANHSWLGGGFLGVEVFFVVSGYLITLLLTAERERTGHVSLASFWWRRARRLLPALVVLLVGATVWTALFARERLGMLRGDVVSGLLYGANWFQIWTGESYTSDFAFAPLRHLWSLAVEEQWYIVWPVVIAVATRRMRARRLPVIGFVLLAAALAVSAWTAFMFRTGPVGDAALTPDQYVSLFGRDVLRSDFLYLGTISRSSGLLLGAALAMVWRPWALRRGGAARSAGALDVLGIAGLVALAAMAWSFRTVTDVVDGGQQPWMFLYRGGFLVAGLATIAVIASVMHPQSRLGRWVLATPPLVWIGKRSYGLYLYHWFIFQAHRRLAGAGLDPVEFAWLMAVTLVVTEISYRFVELPIRDGRARALFARVRSAGDAVPRLAAIALVVTVVPAWSGWSLVTADVVADEITESLDENEDAVTRITTTTVSETPTTAAPGSTTTSPMQKLPFDVFAVGDSVMLGAAKKLTSLGLTVDAAKNRQVIEALQIFNYYKSTKELGERVVVHLGTNGTTKKSTYESILAPLADVDTVVVLTVRVPDREYETLNNDIIRALPTAFPNVQVVDWWQLSDDKPEWFAADGVHLNDTGRDEYARAILSAFGR